MISEALSELPWWIPFETNTRSNSPYSHRSLARHRFHPSHSLPLELLVAAESCLGLTDIPSVSRLLSFGICLLDCRLPSSEPFPKLLSTTRRPREMNRAADVDLSAGLSIQWEDCWVESDPSRRIKDGVREMGQDVQGRLVWRNLGSRCTSCWWILDDCWGVVDVESSVEREFDEESRNERMVFEQHRRWLSDFLTYLVLLPIAISLQPLPQIFNFGMSQITKKPHSFTTWCSNWEFRDENGDRILGERGVLDEYDWIILLPNAYLQTRPL